MRSELTATLPNPVTDVMPLPMPTGGSNLKQERVGHLSLAKAMSNLPLQRPVITVSWILADLEAFGILQAIPKVWWDGIAHLTPSLPPIPIWSAGACPTT